MSESMKTKRRERKALSGSIEVQRRSRKVNRESSAVWSARAAAFSSQSRDVKQSGGMRNHDPMRSRGRRPGCVSPFTSFRKYQKVIIIAANVQALLKNISSEIRN